MDMDAWLTQKKKELDDILNEKVGFILIAVTTTVLYAMRSWLTLEKEQGLLLIIIYLKQL